MSPPCASEPKKNGQLYRIDGERGVTIISSPGLLTPISVDDGRVLVDHEDGTYDLLRADGSLLRSFSFNAAVVRGIRLEGRDLAVLTTTSLEVTNAETGEFLGRWPVPGENARLDDVQDGLAVLTVGTTIHLLRLKDGRTAAIDIAGANVLTQLEPSGLFYAYRVDDSRYPGRVRFVPFDELPLR